MNIKEVLAELDQLFEEHQVDKVEEFLQNKLLEAKKEKDTSSMITIVNELIGFYRDMSQYDQALAYCDQIVILMKQCGYEGTVPYATTLLNVANAKRAAGLWDESANAYEEVARIYENHIEANDYRYASLYNNLSLLYQEQQKYESAKECLLKALHIITQYNNTQIEIATTHTNLATTLLRLGEIKEAMDHLILALSIFEEDEGKDYHYSAALSAMGDAKYLQNDYEASCDYYKKAMEHLEKHVGRTEAYERIAENLKIVQDKMQEQKPAEEKKNTSQSWEEATKEKSFEKEEDNKDQNQLHFYLEEPSEEDFDDDYDIDCEDDFERNDYELKIEFPEDFYHKDSDSEELESEFLKKGQLESKEISEDDFEEDGTVSEDDFEEESAVRKERLEEESAVSEDDFEEDSTVRNDGLLDVNEGKEEASEEIEDHSLFLEHKGLENSEKFYEEYGKQMIHEKFPEYEDKIAVGLVGEGSECYGFDDKLSMDHDYGAGFCLWVTKETYDAIGTKLEKAYKQLVEEHGGILRKETIEGQSRLGVTIIEDFYERLTGLSKEPKNDLEWYGISEGALASAINGKVFRDDEGIFSGIRKKMAELYPEKIRIYRIAEELAKISQDGQYNYPRMMIRRDYVTAKIYLAKFMKHTMNLVYLLNREYETYDKWKRRGIKELPILGEIGCILDAIADMPDQRKAWSKEAASYNTSKLNTDDEILLTIEIIAKLLLEEMKLQGFVSSDDLYLDHHKQEILKITEDPMKTAKIRMRSKERIRTARNGEEFVWNEENDQEEITETKEMAHEPGEEIEIPVLEETEYQSFISYSPVVPKELFGENMKEVDIKLNKDPFLSYRSNTLEMELEEEKVSEESMSVEESIEEMGEEPTPVEESIEEMGEEPTPVEESIEEMGEEPTPVEEPNDKEAMIIAAKIEEARIRQQQEWVREAVEKKNEEEDERKNLIDQIVLLEWKQFDEVQNEGGRADCQDDWETFSIMRKSQYLTWTKDVLESFYQDLAEAEAAGWNLITEKYARMMESTAPERYLQIKDTLPKMSEDKKNVSEQIIKIQIGWMEDFKERYPLMAGNARSIHTYEDTPYNTSYETYLRGELGTYSDETLALYGRMIVNYSKEEKNLAELIMTNTALLYGYASLDEAEERLRNS